MPKNIVLLSDGTNNSSSKLFKTNVYRLYQTLDLAQPNPTSPGGPEQIAYYDDGVGTSSFKPLAILGGAFGWGLKRNVIDLYTFLCQNYESGDQIFCFGFSRGAFTIRVLTGLINSQGLVNADTKAELRRLATNAYRAYRDQRYRSFFRMERPFRALRNIVLQGVDRAKGVTSKSPRTPQGTPITFLGLWDTVAAYGLPIDELTRAWRAVIPLSMPDREPSQNITRACHALALDDERKTFHPVLWNERNLDGQNIHTRRIRDEQFSQVWFAGMHSNVGGGYPDDALAYVSLDWVMGEAEAHGLRFKPGERQKVQTLADMKGVLYDSRQGLGGTYRYLPRKLAVLTNDDEHDVVIARPKIHESVFARMEKGCDRYAPIGLPGRYAVVTAKGDIQDLPSANDRSLVIESQTQAKSRSNLQENVWNLVWWKRVFYFLSVMVAAALAAFPLYRPATGTCEEIFCWLSPIVSGIGMLLPGFVGPWLNAYQSHPLSFAALALGLIVLIWIGSRLQVRIFDTMRALWMPALQHPRQTVPVAPLPDDALFRLRTHRYYKAFFDVLVRYVLPSLAGALAVWVILAGISQGLFAMMSAGGLVCTPTKSDQMKPDILTEGAFPSNALCWASGTKLRKGKRYKFTIAINKTEWKDGDNIQPGVGGFGLDQMTPAMYPGLLFRRYIGEPWFKPVARIGTRGSDEYLLNPADLSLPDQATTKLVAEITARRDGELFLFVNDAVLPFPKAWQWFYKNNRGTATVTVQPVDKAD
ncbi:MAG TPA: DUF2235 domain-containing protein [Nitrospiraceae bacterium]|nr:DUF2235 domain-containing protein [Nitrospiraceae bacterium]